MPPNRSNSPPPDPRADGLGRPVVTITIGKPFLLSDLSDEPVSGANRDLIAERMMGRIADLLPPDYGGHAKPALITN